MTLTEYPGIEQGSEAWHDLRRGMVTASVVGQLVTPTLKVAANMDSRALAALLVAERITGFTDPSYVSEDMERGWEDEARAIETYSKWRKTEVASMGFMVRDDWGFPIGYSPDGLVEELGLVEVKSRRPKIQVQTILGDKVPGPVMAQLQTALLVSGRQWIDYLSYAGGMPLWPKRIYPDQKWFDAIVEAVRAFEKAATEMAATYRDAVVGLPMTERVIEMDMVIR